MIRDLPELLEEAQRTGRALGAFSCYDAETAVGVLRAAAGRPVVLLVPARLLEVPGGHLVAWAICAMATRVATPVAVQLDHAHDLDTVRLGLDCGVGAVMADGSHLPLGANIEFVRAVRALAAPRGVAVEAAAGLLAGDEDVALAAIPGRPTDPAEAAELVDATGADCVSVAIGNVHGDYRTPPSLDRARLQALVGAAGVPLVLHGGSGLSPTETRNAIVNGISKVNYNTELRRSYLARTADALAAALAHARLLDVHRSQMDAVEALAREKLAVLGAAGADLATASR